MMETAMNLMVVQISVRSRIVAMALLQDLSSVMTRTKSMMIPARILVVCPLALMISLIKTSLVLIVGVPVLHVKTLLISFYLYGLTLMASFFLCPAKAGTVWEKLKILFHAVLKKNLLLDCIMLR